MAKHNESKASSIMQEPASWMATKEAIKSLRKLRRKGKMKVAKVVEALDIIRRDTTCNVHASVSIDANGASVEFDVNDSPQYIQMWFAKRGRNAAAHSGDHQYRFAFVPPTKRPKE